MEASWVPRWWERIDREEALSGVRTVSSGGGCLVLQGDDYAGRKQAAGLAREELERWGYTVERMLAPAATAWTEGEALIEAWGRLSASSVFSLSPGASIAGLSPEYIGEQLAALLRHADFQTALVFDDVGRDSGRDYSFQPVFAKAATEAGSPIVVTYNPSLVQWSLRENVRLLSLADFGLDDVRECVKHASELRGVIDEKVEDAVKLVFHGTEGDTVRPAQAYVRLAAWGKDFALS